MGRSASLVLVSAAGELLGMLPPFDVDGPYWPECADLVAEARSRFGVELVILRLLLADASTRSGGPVTYSAELVSGRPNVALQPIAEALQARALAPDEKRVPWAERGGPARSLAWARAALNSDCAALQQRSWNLSTLWRLRPPGARATIWLKEVPRFMRYESRVLSWLNAAVPGAAPTLLATDDNGRSLLAHLEGEDLYGAPVALRQAINQRLHGIQCAGVDAAAELIARGIPDWRGARRGADIRSKLCAWSHDYPGLEGLLRSLDEQLERLEGCALPATLVHSDNHPGNARGSLEGVALLDWGEAFIGSPVTDVLGAIAGLSSAEAAPLLERWCADWKRLAPRSLPERALAIGPFLAAMHGAATYAHFLAQIEESEWPYHQQDVPRCLEAAKALLRSAVA